MSSNKIQACTQTKSWLSYYFTNNLSCTTQIPCKPVLTEISVCGYEIAMIFTNGMTAQYFLAVTAHSMNWYLEHFLWNWLRRLPQNPIYDKSKLVQAMAWCHQTASHYLSQCWPRSMSPYGITGPHWVNSYWYNSCIQSELCVKTPEWDEPQTYHLGSGRLPTNWTSGEFGVYSATQTIRNHNLTSYRMVLYEDEKNILQNISHSKVLNFKQGTDLMLHTLEISYSKCWIIC